MTGLKQSLIGGLLLIAGIVATSSFAGDITHSTPGLSGYDAVAYFTDGKPVRGSGYHVVVQDGVTYAFASAEHKKLFIANPKQYLPAFGGFCADGVAVGKKFLADPEGREAVEGILYLNLDKGIQEKWQRDIPGYIKKGNTNWSDIKDKSPDAL